MSLGISGGSSSSSSTMNQLVQQLFDQATKTSQTGSTSTSQTGSTTGTTTGGTDTSRTLSPEQAQTGPMLFKLIQQLSTNPEALTGPAQNQARNQVDENYAGTDEALRQQFMTGGGGGGSGKYGRAVLSSDLARRGKLSDVDTSFAQTRAQAPLTAAQLAQNFLGLDFGQSSKTNATSTGGTSTAGTTVDQSNGTVATSGGSTQTTTGTEDKSGHQFGGSVGI